MAFNKCIKQLKYPHLKRWGLTFFKFLSLLSLSLPQFIKACKFLVPNSKQTCCTNVVWWSLEKDELVWMIDGYGKMEIIENTKVLCDGNLLHSEQSLSDLQDITFKTARGRSSRSTSKGEKLCVMWNRGIFLFLFSFFFFSSSC